MADTVDLKSTDESREGSNPSLGTIDDLTKWPWFCEHGQRMFRCEDCDRLEPGPWDDWE